MKKTLFVMLLASLLVFSSISCDNSTKEPSTPVQPEKPVEELSGDNLTKVKTAYKAVQDGAWAYEMYEGIEVTEGKVEEFNATVKFTNCNIDGVIIEDGTLKISNSDELSTFDADVTYDGVRIELVISFKGETPVEDTIIVSLDDVKYSVSVSDIIAQA